MDKSSAGRNIINKITQHGTIIDYETLHNIIDSVGQANAKPQVENKNV